MATYPLITIVGPTASGKSELAMNLAKKHSSVIICADSRTIYKGLDIGTAKPTREDRAKVPHIGLDICNPNEYFSAADFQKLAEGAIDKANKEGLLPILVGGTGLYVDGVVNGFQFGPKPPQGQRIELEGLTNTELQARIESMGLEMPENKQNKRYLIRAIEQSGINRDHKRPSRDTLIIGINPGKEVLSSRIEQRVAKMIENGVVEETKWLIDNYGLNCPGASGNIYRALADYFNNLCTLEVAIEKFIRLDKLLAKKQMTWFKRNKDMAWYENSGEALANIQTRLNQTTE